MLAKVRSRKESARPREQLSDLLGQDMGQKGVGLGPPSWRQENLWQPGTGQCLRRADPQQQSHNLRFHLFAKKKKVPPEFDYEYVFFPKFEVLFSNL